jgi:hypothetical protein
MPLFLDIHRKVEGLTGDKIAQAHRMNLQVRDKHGVKFQEYWYNEETGQAFCLHEAPNKEAGQEAHREAHRLIADETQKSKRVRERTC